MTTEKGKLKKVSTQNTKAEILNAYDQLLEELKDLEKSEPAQDTTFSVAKTIDEIPNSEEIFSQITNLKQSVNKKISEIMDEMSKKTEKLNTLKELLKNGEEELTEIYKIKNEAGTLKNLIQIREDFEKKIEKEKKELDINFEELKKKAEKEYATKLEDFKVKNQREEENYLYNLQKERQEEEDKYQSERKAKIIELEEREKLLKEQEKELKDLREEVSSFEKTLSKSVEVAVQECETAVRTELENKYKLETKDFESELKLKSTEITNLRQQLDKQDKEIETLKKDLSMAREQMKDMAISVIQGNSEQRNQKVLRQEELSLKA